MWKKLAERQIGKYTEHGDQVKRLIKLQTWYFPQPQTEFLEFFLYSENKSLLKFYILRDIQYTREAGLGK